MSCERQRLAPVVVDDLADLIDTTTLAAMRHDAEQLTELGTAQAPAWQAVVDALREAHEIAEYDERRFERF